MRRPPTSKSISCNAIIGAQALNHVAEQDSFIQPLQTQGAVGQASTDPAVET
jgi:hypothetical protein